MSKIPKLRFPEFEDAPEWESEKLKDISEINPKDKVSLKNLRLDSYISTENLLPNYEGVKVAAKLPTTGSFTEYRVNDILFSNIRPYLKKVWKATKTGACSNDVLVLRAKEKCNNKFLSQLLKNDIFIDYVMIGAKGVKMPRGDVDAIKKYQVFMPYDKTEQEKIADCLSSLDELIVAEDKKLTLLKEEKKALMQKLFPKEGQTVPEWRFPEFRECGEWERFRLDELAQFRRGSFPQPYGLSKWYDENGFPFIQVFDVDDNLHLKSFTKNRISKLAAEQSVFISKDSIVVTIQGSIGRVAITQYDAYVDRTLLVFEKFFKEIEKTFIAYTLQLLFDIEKEKAPGGIIKTITKEVLSNFIVSIPSFGEQQNISNSLSSLDELIFSQEKKIQQLKLHKKALMQGLFVGGGENDYKYKN